MTSVTLVEVQKEETGLRLETWFRSTYPNLSNSELHKLIRTGQIRLNGGRAKPGDRITGGQIIRVPPFSSKQVTVRGQKKGIIDSNQDINILKKKIIHIDKNFIVLNKPPGIPVQGGSKIKIHIDGMLDSLRFGNSERPRLVHRLDKHTSGALLIARSRKASQLAMNLFQKKLIRKLYWGVVVGVPKPSKGKIVLNLNKKRTKFGERVVLDKEKGKPCQSLYKVLETAGKTVSLVGLEPLTGRTHQLRVHLKEGLGTSILGDGKYGGAGAYLHKKDIKNSLSLHCRGLKIPSHGTAHIYVYAPLPKTFLELCDDFGFQLKPSFDQFL